MRTRLAVYALLGVLLGAFVLTPLSASAAKPNPTPTAVSAPVSSTPTNSSTGVLTNGEFTLQQFATQDGQLVAIGTLTGSVTSLLSGASSPVDQLVTLPVSAADGSCQILHLELGPLDLNLLGLIVHLDQVVLDITAQQGPGNLLGNLLCGVAGLLDSNVINNTLANLLNQLLSLLGLQDRSTR